MKPFIVLALLLSVSVSVSSAQPEQPATVPRPFHAGERLSYDISWLNVTAGTAVMEVAPEPAGANRHEMMTVVTTARSSPMITKFYPVDNRVESSIDLSTMLPQHMTFQRREGKRKNDFDYTFHHGEGTVTAIKDGTSDTLQIPPATQDAISCLYFVRKALPMSPGSALTMNVHHDKKNYKLEVRVEAVETLKGPWGKLEAARALVIMPFQGIFLNQGNLRVWFTTDEQRIPLRMKAKVIIGSITADLVDGLPGRVSAH